MYARPLFWVALAGLFGLVLLTLWFLVLRPSETNLTVTHQSGDTSLRMLGGDTWEYWDDGSPRYRLQSKTASFDVSQSAGKFSNLNLTVYEQNSQKSPWSVQADEGSLTRRRIQTLLTAQSEMRIEISLKNNVVVNKTQPDGTVIRLHTSQLNYNGATNNITSSAGIKQYIEPPDAPVIILTATNFKYDPVQGQTVLLYRGDVELERAELSLDADTVRVALDDAQISNFHASGKPAHFAYQGTADIQTTTGSAKDIDYEPESQILRLTGDATLTQPGGTLTSDRIQYNLGTRTVVAYAGQTAPTPSSPPPNTKAPRQ